MSHTLALQAGLAANRDYFLVLENDCSTDVPLLFWQILKEAVDGMPEGWTVLQLGADSAGPAALSRRVCHRNITLETSRANSASQSGIAWLMRTQSRRRVLQRCYICFEMVEPQTRHSCPCKDDVSVAAGVAAFTFPLVSCGSIGRQTPIPVQLARFNSGQKA